MLRFVVGRLVFIDGVSVAGDKLALGCSDGELLVDTLLPILFNSVGLLLIGDITGCFVGLLLLLFDNVGLLLTGDIIGCLVGL